MRKDPWPDFNTDKAVLLPEMPDGDPETVVYWSKMADYHKGMAYITEGSIADHHRAEARRCRH